eukprot:TRINITY_DN644_c0_g1_i9.p1 TRINITY_DN644_c0_g1~~TRINITY_DN644_c0_g1_i9.p1  ORF type:complete len:1380 (-),score=371.30 TRINITY_DN644_c0_g1_i9:163-4302(-)
MADPSIDEVAGAAWNGERAKLASRLTNPSVVKLINTPSSRGQTALYCAARQGHVGCLLELLKLPSIKVTVHVAEHGGTPLHAAGFNQHAECVALLLARGADPNAKNNVGLTARQDARGNEVLKVYKIWESSKSKDKAIAALQKKYVSVMEVANVKAPMDLSTIVDKTKKITTSNSTTRSTSKSNLNARSKSAVTSTHAVDTPAPLLKLHAKNVGYLHCIKAGGKRERKYYCILTTTAFVCYSSESADAPKENHLLSSLRSCKVTEERNFVFELSLKESKHVVLRAESKEIMNSWISLFSEALKNPQPQPSSANLALNIPSTPKSTTTTSTTTSTTTKSGSSTSRSKQSVECNLFLGVIDTQELAVQLQESFCTIHADSNEISRTEICWFCPKPFWNFENLLRLSSSSKELLIQLWDVNRMDKPVAYVKITKSELERVGTRSGPVWLPLVRKVPEISIILETKDLGDSKFSVRVMRVSGLLTNQQVAFSIVIKEDGNPVASTEPKTDAVWDSQPFTVSASAQSIDLLLVTAQNNRTIASLSISGQDVRDKNFHGLSEWTLNGPQMGFIRLHLRQFSSVVLETSSYEPLFSLLSQNGMEVIKFMAMQPKIGWRMQHLAQALIRAFHSRKMGGALLRNLVTAELHASNPENLFFRETLITKALDAYLKLVGNSYLQQTLKPIVGEILAGNKPCELHPHKLGQDFERRNIHANNVMYFCTAILDALLKSVESIPLVLRQIFSEIKTLATQLWPNHRTKKWTAVSTLFFHRFLCGAMMDPKGFNLTTEHPNANSKRDLVMITKVFQKLSNLVIFPEQEFHMMGLNQFVVQNMGRVQSFVDEISRPVQGVGEDAQDLKINFKTEMSIVEHLLQEIVVEVPAFATNAKLAEVLNKLRSEKTSTNEKAHLGDPFICANVNLRKEIPEYTSINGEVIKNANRSATSVTSASSATSLASPKSDTSARSPRADTSSRSETTSRTETSLRAETSSRADSSSRSETTPRSVDSDKTTDAMRTVIKEMASRMDLLEARVQKLLEENLRLKEELASVVVAKDTTKAPTSVNGGPLPVARKESVGGNQEAVTPSSVTPSPVASASVASASVASASVASVSVASASVTPSSVASGSVTPSSVDSSPVDSSSVTPSSVSPSPADSSSVTPSSVATSPVDPNSADSSHAESSSAATNFGDSSSVASSPVAASPVASSPVASSSVASSSVASSPVASSSVASSPVKSASTETPAVSPDSAAPSIPALPATPKSRIPPSWRSPRVTEPRVAEPRAAEPRAAEPRAPEPREPEPRVTEAVPEPVQSTLSGVSAHEEQGMMQGEYMMEGGMQGEYMGEYMMEGGQEYMSDPSGGEYMMEGGSYEAGYGGYAGGYEGEYQGGY